MEFQIKTPKVFCNRKLGAIKLVQLLLILVFLVGIFFGVQYFDIGKFLGSSDPAKSMSTNSDITACLVEVRGDSGRGSGFFSEIKGKNFLVTNIHVLSGNEKVEFYASNGEVIKTGQIFAAAEYDIAIIQVGSAPAVLSIQEEIDKQDLENKKVIVSGNALGDGVFSSIKGKVLAVGPQLIEVDAKFVSGHSGSPIISKDIMGNHKVLGVATFTRTTKLQGRDKLSRYDDTRWYGYRMDNIQKWQKVDWSRFSKEGKRLREIENRTEDIVRFFTTGRGPIAKDKDIIALSRDLQRHGTLRQRSIDSYESTFKSYITQVLMKDIGNNHFYQYTYHRKRFEEQKKIREEMAEIINEETFFY